MCAPIAVAMGLMASAGAVQAYGQRQQGKVAQKIAKYNAAIARNRAADALKRGGIEAAEHRGRINALVGRQRAAIGASGAVVDMGATADLVRDTTVMGELEALTIKNNAMREAWGFETMATQSLFEGKAAKQAGTLGAVGTLLSTGGQVASMKAGR